MKEVLDLSELLGLVRLDEFPAQLEKVDFSPYEGKKVQMRGCVPVWAHLAVAAKLMERVEELEFLVDDGKQGKPIQIYAKA
ncbi:MAG: hypothetical protein ACE5EW_08065 [Thermoplasmata archaeon]